MTLTNADVTLNPRLAGQVKRYHVRPTLHAQSVGEHTWQVLRLYIELWGLPSAEVIYRILHHDTPEIMTGDLPFRATDSPSWAILKSAMKDVERETQKQMGLELYELTPEEKAKIKIADLLEMYEFGQHEWMLGNQYGLLICQNVGRVALEIVPLGVVKLVHDTVEKWLLNRGWPSCIPIL